MYDLYLPLVKNPNPDAVIQVEKITGPILLISSKMDNMWPSEPAAEQIMKRLEDYDFPYSYQHLVSALSKVGFSMHTNPVIMIARC